MKLVIFDLEVNGHPIADLVLALYQHHVGMSTILVRATAAKPVLASAYGLNSTYPSTIDEGISLLPSKQSYPFDTTTATGFAKANSPTQFVQALWHQLTSRVN